MEWRDQKLQKKSLVVLESNESISQKIKKNNANREPFEKKSAQTENLKLGPERERERESLRERKRKERNNETISRE